MDTTEIPLSFGYINNNEIQYFKNDKNRKVNDILSTLDTNSIQVYNYADKQEISIRKGVSSTNLYTGSDGNDKSCLKGKTCYGSGNSFSDECSAIKGNFASHAFILSNDILSDNKHFLILR